VGAADLVLGERRPIGLPHDHEHANAIGTVRERHQDGRAFPALVGEASQERPGRLGQAADEQWSTVLQCFLGIGIPERHPRARRRAPHPGGRRRHQLAGVRVDPGDVRAVGARGDERSARDLLDHLVDVERRRHGGRRFPQRSLLPRPAFGLIEQPRIVHGGRGPARQLLGQGHVVGAEPAPGGGHHEAHHAQGVAAGQQGHGEHRTWPHLVHQGEVLLVHGESLEVIVRETGQQQRLPRAQRRGQRAVG
jgi:hypothetical protein